MSRRNLLLGVAAVVVGLVTAFVAIRLYDGGRGGEIVIEGAPADAQIAVWIDGAVATPGVYRLGSDARLNDAIVAAGGLAEDADLAQVNLASRLTDAQHVVIPRTSQVAAGSGAATPALAASGAQAASTRVATININTASAAELDALPGIGPVIAARIVAYREANGPFTRIEELARVQGVSPAMVDAMRDLITVGP